MIKIYLVKIKIWGAKNMGDINVFTGPMKCGKTQKLLDEAQRQEIAGKKIQVFKPKIDDRFSDVQVISRKGYKTDAVAINEIDEIKNYDADVYVIDEFQFLKGDLKELYRLSNAGKKFYIAGLNLTAERKPFGKMGDLLCMSDNVQILTSVCEVCRNDNAIYTYYKGDNKTGDILVGEDCYIPVCRKCYDKLMKEKENK